MIRIYHARILTMEEDQDIFDGEIWISGTKIQYAGPEKKEEAAKITWDREINAKGNLIMPGFKNAHTHSAMTFLRSHADDMPLLSWLNDLSFIQTCDHGISDKRDHSECGYVPDTRYDDRSIQRLRLSNDSDRSG